MSFFSSCAHDWQPSAKSIAPPVQQATNMKGTGDGYFETVQKMLLGHTTLIYQCAKCKELRREETLGQGDFVKKP